MSIHWAKESSGSLVDALVSIQLFDASLKTLSELVCHVKGQKLWVVELLVHDNI